MSHMSHMSHIWYDIILIAIGHHNPNTTPPNHQTKKQTPFPELNISEHLKIEFTYVFRY